MSGSRSPGPRPSPQAQSQSSETARHGLPWCLPRRTQRAPIAYSPSISLKGPTHRASSLGSGLMKSEADIGAMVVCGFDARATAALWRTSLGLFDYWGCPWAKGDAVIALIERLRGANTI